MTGSVLLLQLPVDPTFCCVPPDNTAQVVDLIQELVDNELSSSEELDDSMLESVVKKLTEVVDVTLLQPSVGNDIVDVLANILLSDTDFAPVADM